ncbi:MAG: hypothetical protein H0W03_06620 [Solirubrobacterales bacterium]|nr:hypothetical protein [Solirubrobacterales bacterium]
MREGTLEQLLTEGGHVRVRVAREEVTRAQQALATLSAEPVTELGERGPGSGWLTVRVQPSEAGRVNRALAEAGIYAIGLEGGSDLESVFLSATAGDGIAGREAPAGPPLGWGQRPGAPA